MRKVILLIIAMSFVCLGWHSCGPFDNHEPNGIFIIESLIDPEEYPDIHLYDNTITNNCNYDAEDKAHQPNPGVQNTGDMDKLWGEATTRYDEYKFGDTYTRLGYMLHLVQDMAVPAHAFNIPHYEIRRRQPDPLEQTRWMWPGPGIGPTSYATGYNVDDFEAYASEVRGELKGDPTVQPPDLGKKPEEAYKESLKNTIRSVKQDKPTPPTPADVPNWLQRAREIAAQYPDREVALQFWGYGKIIPLETAEKLYAQKHKWLDYWCECSSYVADKVTFEGAYGGKGMADGYRKFPPDKELKEKVWACVLLQTYPGSRVYTRETRWMKHFVIWWYQEHHEIVDDRYNAAAKYGAAMLMAASKALPPLLDIKQEDVSVSYYELGVESAGWIHVELKNLSILENRKPQIVLTVEIVDYGLKWTSPLALQRDPKKRLPYVYGPEDLMFSAPYMFEIVPEKVKVRITATDEDNNTDVEEFECAMATGVLPG